jgi:O-antigen ligase
VAEEESPLAAVAAAVALAVGTLVVTQPLAILLLLLAAFPWEGMLAFPTAQVTVVKVLGALVFAGYVVRALGSRELIRSPPELVPLALLAVFVLASETFSRDPAAGLIKTSSYFLFIAFVFVFVQLVRSDHEVLRCLRVIGLSAAVAAAYGLWVFLSGRAPRAGGPIGEPNDFAFVLSGALPLMAFLAVTERHRRVLWGVAFAVTLAAILATVSRGALVGLAAVAVWALVTRRVPIRGTASAVALGAVAVVLAYAAFGSVMHEALQQKGYVASANVDSRKALWGLAVRVSMDNPLLGVGPSMFGKVGEDYVNEAPPDFVAHNSYLDLLSESGIFALLAFGAYLVMVWRLIGRARKRAVARGDPVWARLMVALHAALVVVLVAANFLSVQLMTPFWLLGALAVSAAYAPREGRLR